MCDVVSEYACASRGNARGAVQGTLFLPPILPLPQVLTSPAAAKERVTPKSTREKTRMVDWLVVTVGRLKHGWSVWKREGGR